MEIFGRISKYRYYIDTYFLRYVPSLVKKTNNTLLLVLGLRCRCHCHRYFSCHILIFNWLLQNFRSVLRMLSVTCTHSFGTAVLPHVENGWMMQNFWRTPRNKNKIKLIFNNIVTGQTNHYCFLFISGKCWILHVFQYYYVCRCARRLLLR